MRSHKGSYIAGNMDAIRKHYHCELSCKFQGAKKQPNKIKKNGWGARKCRALHA